MNMIKINKIKSVINFNRTVVCGVRRIYMYIIIIKTNNAFIYCMFSYLTGQSNSLAIAMKMNDVSSSDEK